MSIKDVMIKRKSIRTYKSEEISSEVRLSLTNFIDIVKAPFDTEMRFELVEIDNKDSDVKLGTYGVIRGAKTFICAALQKKARYEENLGYVFEKIILHATSLGLGTCWLGGTFNRAGFGKAMGLKDNEIIPIVTPIGYAKEKRSLLDTVMVTIAGSKNRKEWSELFFDGSFEKPLQKDKTDKLVDIFEMVRIAPSASNKQPWRIIKEGGAFHFFISRSVGYAKALNFDIQRLDIGIAMCHFEMMASEIGVIGKWVDRKPGFSFPSNTEYIISFE